MAKTQGIHHLGLTVPDIVATRDFFVNLLGFQQVGGKPDYPAVFVSDGSVMLTLWQAVEPATATPFNRKTNVGLHHFALKVENLESLNALHSSLQGTDAVEIEFPPTPLGSGPAQHMMFTIPGGIRLELFASA